MLCLLMVSLLTQVVGMKEGDQMRNRLRGLEENWYGQCWEVLYISDLESCIYNCHHSCMSVPSINSSCMRISNQLYPHPDLEFIYTNRSRVSLIVSLQEACHHIHDPSFSLGSLHIPIPTLRLTVHNRTTNPLLSRLICSIINSYICAA